MVNTFNGKKVTAAIAIILSMIAIVLFIKISNIVKDPINDYDKNLNESYRCCNIYFNLSI